MKLVVGLGNPGRRYEGTRHNIGFAVVAELARTCGRGSAREKFHAEVMEAELAGEKALLVCPSTYMNRSGLSVAAARAFYKIADHELLVICDDMNLPLAKMRFRPQGSSGGQKGLENIIAQLGTDAFPRVRVGIGAAPPNWAWADYVLSKFTAEELPEIQRGVATAAEAVVAWAREGIQYCMNHFN